MSTDSAGSHAFDAGSTEWSSEELTARWPLLPSELSFRGRIGRRSFWKRISILFSIEVVLTALLVLGGAFSWGAEILAPLAGALLVALWAGFATQAQRWHDRDKMAWMLLLNFVPVVGFGWSLVELGFLKGTVGRNRFGV